MSDPGWSLIFYIFDIICLHPDGKICYGGEIMEKIKKRWWLIVGAVGVNLLCHLLTIVLHMETTFLKLGGSYLGVAAAAVALSFLPLRFHIVAQIFVVAAASVGCGMNMYTHVPIYDLLIHYLSGIVLAAGGWEVDKKWLFALLFSWAGAGAWEIFEFSCDVLLQAGMQGALMDTMTDMVAGFLGGITWIVIKILLFCGDSSIIEKKEGQL